MRFWDLPVLLFAPLFAMSLAACNGPIAYDATPAPSPPEDAARSQLGVQFGEHDATFPLAGSDDTFDFVVTVTNLGEDLYEWPDPCPTYYWSWAEGATDYGTGYGYLNCDGGATLGPGDSAEFQMEITAADDAAGTTFGWKLADPRSCNFMTATFADVDRESIETQDSAECYES